jgi:hypothetical protein
MVCNAQFDEIAALPEPLHLRLLMVTAKDAAIRRAAWRFITFATQPAEVAGLTGYFPPNDRAVGLLQDFYRANPNFAVAVSERRYASGWYAFPEPNGLKVIDVIKDKLESVRLALDRCRARQNEGRRLWRAWRLGARRDAAVPRCRARPGRTGRAHACDKFRGYRTDDARLPWRSLRDNGWHFVIERGVATHCSSRRRQAPLGYALCKRPSVRTR